MKIVIISTTDRRGGAAIAACRLFLSLKKYYKGISMLVREKLSSEQGIIEVSRTLLHKAMNYSAFILERIHFGFFMRSKDVLFQFSTANTGRKILKNPVVRESDILHLHWTNQGFLSLRELGRLLNNRKKIVWTMHDMWTFTGGCHYSGDCEGFLEECGNCPFLRTDTRYDLSYRVYKQKELIYKNAEITFVSPSEWLAEKARKSSLIGRFDVKVSPNPIDTEIFKPELKTKIRKSLSLPEDKFLLLAGSANFNDKRKGFSYLIQALHKMVELNPAISQNIGMITFGKYCNFENPPVQVFPQAKLDNDHSIAKLYQAADVFILPSLEDNLPGTVMESLSCGTPVVAFNTGGIPEMVEHQVTGFIGERKNVNDLISGINWIHNHSIPEKISENCRRKVVKEYSPEVVTEKYMNIYKGI